MRITMDIQLKIDSLNWKGLLLFLLSDITMHLGSHTVQASHRGKHALCPNAQQKVHQQYQPEHEFSCANMLYHRNSVDAALCANIGGCTTSCSECKSHLGECENRTRIIIGAGHREQVLKMQEFLGDPYGIYYTITSVDYLSDLGWTCIRLTFCPVIT